MIQSHTPLFCTPPPLQASSLHALLAPAWPLSPPHTPLHVLLSVVLSVML